MPKLLIPPDFSFAKYYTDAEPLPYEGTGAKLRDAVLARTGDLDVVWAVEEDEALRQVADTDYLVAYHVSRRLLERASRLRWIQAGGAGMDHFFKLSDVDAEWLAARGIMLSSAAGITRLVIGEQVLAYMLMFSRGMHRALRQQMDGRWEIFMADELGGRCVGIMGLGGIGTRVAELCKCFGMQVIGTKVDPSSYRGPADEVLPTSALPELLARADFLVVACPISEETRGLLDAEKLAMMKAGAYLINVARGEIVDHDALVSALERGVIAGAGLDTFGPPAAGRSMKNLEELAPTSPLWRMTNVIITPNHASATPRIYDHLADILVDNHRRIRAGREPAHRVA